MGPTTKTITVTGSVTFDDLRDGYRVQAAGLIEGGADLLLLETCQDTRNVKAARSASSEALQEAGADAAARWSPARSSPWARCSPARASRRCTRRSSTSTSCSIGLNCATGPEFMTDHLRTLAALATRCVSVLSQRRPARRGRPATARRRESRRQARALRRRRLAQHRRRLLRHHARAHPRPSPTLAAGQRPRVPPATASRRGRGIDVARPGRRQPADHRRRAHQRHRLRKFKELIVAEKFEEAAEVGRAPGQGAAPRSSTSAWPTPTATSSPTWTRFLARADPKVKVAAHDRLHRRRGHRGGAAPLPGQGDHQLDQPRGRRGALRAGRAPAAPATARALVVGCIDEDKQQGMAVTRERKLAIAERSLPAADREVRHRRARTSSSTRSCFPAAPATRTTSARRSRRSRASALIKARFPECRTILGISNVSFGLPAAGREVLNSVFLYHCMKAGLDFAIVNSEKLERYPSIPEEERQLAEDLLFGPRRRSGGRLRRALPRPRRAAGAGRRARCSLDERLARYIIEGTRTA